MRTVQPDLNLSVVIQTRSDGFHTACALSRRSEIKFEDLLTTQLRHSELSCRPSSRHPFQRLNIYPGLRPTNFCRGLTVDSTVRRIGFRRNDRNWPIREAWEADLSVRLGDSLPRSDLDLTKTTQLFNKSIRAVICLSPRPEALPLSSNPAISLGKSSLTS